MVKLRFNLSCLFFLFSLLFVSCNIEWFSDFKNEQDAITTNEFTFYLDNPDSTSSSGLFYKKSLKLGQVYTLKDLFPSSEFLTQMVGYDFVGWKIIDTAYENVAFDGEYLSSIKAGFTSYTFYGEWKPSTNTHYTVRYFFEKIGGSVYEENISLRLRPSGTTNDVIDVGSLKTSFGDGFTFSKVEYDEKTQARSENGDPVVISPKGDTVISLYYERNKFNLTINWNYSGAAMSDPVSLYYEAPFDFTQITEENQRENYKIAYWSTDSAGIEEFTGEAMPAMDLNLYAIWIFCSNTYYVSTTGSDDNDGSPEHPLATVQRAVNAVITMNNDVVQPYTICITDGAQSWLTGVNYYKALNLTIKGPGDSPASTDFNGTSFVNTLFTINGNANKKDSVKVTLKNVQLLNYISTSSDTAYLNVNNATVMLENCHFNEGKANKTAVYIGSGADVTIKDCEIRQNTSNDSSVLSGCGIINNGKLTLSGKNTINYYEDPKNNTVLLSAGNKFYIADDFDPSSKIYFTLSSYPEYNSVTGKITPVAITDSVTEDYSSCFTCSENGYTVMQDENTGKIIVTKTLSLGSSEIRFYDDVAVTVSYTAGKVKFQTSVPVSDWVIKVYNSYGVECTLADPSASVTTEESSAEVVLEDFWPSGTYNVSISFKYNGVIYSDSVLVTK